MVSRLEDPGPFRISVYDHAFAFQYPLGGCSSVSITPRHLALGTGSITVPLTHKRADDLFTEGRRVVVDYLIGEDRTADESWVHGMSGFLTSATIPQDDLPTVGKSVTFGISDDYWLLTWMLLWANPAAGIGSQTSNAQDVRSGPAETVIKAYVTANATRLGIPLTCATDLGRGASVKGAYRFDNANDVLPILAAQGGLGITIVQSGSGWVLDVYEPADRTARVLSEAAGTITSWSLSSTAPAATRAVIAAQGTGTSRSFSERPASLPSTLESLYGMRLETFVDARDTSDSTTLAQRGDAALLAGVPQAGYAITVAETPVVKAMSNLFVGDKVAVQITPTLALTDVVSQLTITWDASGKTVTPQVGSTDAAAQPNLTLAKSIAAVARGVRYLRSSL